MAIYDTTGRALYFSKEFSALTCDADRFIPFQLVWPSMLSAQMRFANTDASGLAKVQACNNGVDYTDIAFKDGTGAWVTSVPIVAAISKNIAISFPVSPFLWYRLAFIRTAGTTASTIAGEAVGKRAVQL